MADEQIGNKSQADLDALAAKITPPVKKTEHIQGSTAGTASSTVAGNKVDPFAEIEIEFRRQQLLKQAAHEEAMRQVALENAKLSIELQRAQLDDYRDRKDEIANKKENKSQDAKTRGSALLSLAEADRQIQRRCNHKKGGNGLAGVVGGRGDSVHYAVIKHTFCHGDEWIRCLRCGKTWKPPLERSFKTKDQYYIAVAEYKQAQDFQTLNSPSSSSRFAFSDQGANMREIMEPSTLR